MSCKLWRKIQSNLQISTQNDFKWILLFVGRLKFTFCDLNNDFRGKKFSLKSNPWNFSFWKLNLSKMVEKRLQIPFNSWILDQIDNLEGDYIEFGPFIYQEFIRTSPFLSQGFKAALTSPQKMLSNKITCKYWISLNAWRHFEVKNKRKPSKKFNYLHTKLL